MAKIPGPVGTVLGVAKVAKSVYKAAKRVQANKKNLKDINAKVHKKIDAAKAAEKNKKITYPSREQREIRQPRTEPRLEPRTEPRAIDKVLYKKPKN
jgi:hypothetical protein